MDVSTSCVPITLYTKIAKGNRDDIVKEDIFESIFGNPNGLGISCVPYIYCVSPQQVKRNIKQKYYLELTFRWPPNARIKDETKSDAPTNPTYEEYLGLGYIGVERRFTDSQRYVIFDPMAYLVRIQDVDTMQILYENDLLEKDLKASIPGDDWVKVSRHFFRSGVSKQQMEINTLMIDKIGAHYIDIKRDFFCVSEIARRKGVSERAVTKYLKTLIGRITVNEVSGCWISSKRGDYKRTFWLSKGGLNFADIFHFPQVIGCHKTNVVIKNKNILHSIICETTHGSDHTMCCRPFHLKLGTSRENAIHIKIRKSLDQLFDFDYKEMQEYCFHVLRLSNLIEKQVYTVTEDEAKIQRRRSNRIVYSEEMGTGKRKVDVCGDPDMGDEDPEPNVSEMTKDEEEDREEEEEAKIWKLLDEDCDEEHDNKQDLYRNQYLTMLENDKEETDVLTF
jgi:hypothetical protein